MATIKDVAKLAGVAISTVSYALNGSDKISLDTKRKVEEAAKTLNYKKNGFASDLKRTKTNTIALILTDLSGPFYSELIQGVQDVTTSNGYDLIACSSIGGPKSTAVKFLTEKRVDGAIILAHNISDELTLKAANTDFPIVMMDRFIESELVYQVEVDNFHGGYLATEHLLKQGHREIAYISGPSNSQDNHKRYRGYLKALNDYSIPSHPKWNINSDFTRNGGYRATKLLIAQKDLPQAIFYGNDEMAIGGLQAFKEKNIQVPEDISIIGFDDIELAEFTSPALTTIKQPKYEAGSLAAHLIFRVLAGEKVNNHYTLSTELVERESVKPFK
ncbi:LacI family transcriptional regulator [Pullulanibacillus pueri]|uniref:LacI family transcriptional regulator n=1 Tax=Pullulanibacillus pueri TaxID=1437324 RepID=A0A8J3ELC9_9BACL|nr:LacI family DNA-binding transcriptional regulator [Pullulanibacillus pueri]MBM7680831.1 LacI family transcriptional regulator [Pullulanibacillus pueri]GGH78502.1 LacI family transcriptional regulator [Pullulanibacillus pueri]